LKIIRPVNLGWINARFLALAMAFLAGSAFGQALVLPRLLPNGLYSAGSYHSSFEIRN